MKTRSTGATLSEILGVAVEYNLHLNPDEFIRYLDFYSAYLSRTEDIEGKKVGDPANFYEFISSQNTLNLAASMATFETGEVIMAPTAFRYEDWERRNNSESEENNLNSEL